MNRRPIIAAVVVAATSWGLTGTATSVAEPDPPAPRTTAVAGPVLTAQPLERGRVVYPKLVTSRGGTSTIVWELESRIRAARTTADGSWGRIRDLGPGRAPDVAIDGRGRVTAVWRTLNGRDLTVRRHVRGSWRPPAVLTLPSAAEFVHVWPYRVAANAAGDLLAAWTRGYGPDPGQYQKRLEVAYRPRGGPWGAPVELDRRDVDVAAAFVHRDTATVVYDDHGSPAIRRRGPGGVWGSVVRLGGHLAGTAANLRGRLVVSVLDGNALVVHERVPGTGWLSPQPIAPVERRRGVAPMAIDGQGRAAVAFISGAGRLRVARRPAGSPWGPPVVVSPVGQHAVELRLAAGPGGRLGAAWIDNAAEHPRVWVAGFVPGSGWSAAVAMTGTRSRSIYSLDLGFEPDGDLILAWSDRLAGRTGQRVVTRTVTLAPT